MLIYTIERAYILELERGKSNQSRRGIMTAGTKESDIDDENMKGFGEQVPATNVEENAPNSRRYRVEAEEATLKYLNKLEVMGNIPDIATSYLQKSISRVEFFEKVAPYIKLPSCNTDPPKQWNSQ